MAADRSAWSVLAVPLFRRLWTAQLVSAVGSGAQTMAIAWGMLHLTGRPSAAALVVGIRFVPVVLLGVHVGALVDQADARRLLRVAVAAAVVVNLAVAALCVTGSLAPWHLYALAVLGGLSLTVEGPALQRLLAGAVPDGRLADASSLNGLLLDVSKVAAPAAAGMLLAVHADSAVYAFNAVSYLLLAVIVTRVPGPARSSAPHTAGVRAGLRYVVCTPAAWSTVSLLGFQLSAIIPVVVSIRHHGSAFIFGPASAASGVGAVAGTLATARTARGPSNGKLAGATAGAGAALLLAAVNGPWPLTVVAFAAAGAGTGAVFTLCNVRLQVPIAPEYRLFG